MLQTKGYVPLLRTKISEVQAFGALSAGVKENCLPVFLARPWPNANHFQLTINKVQGAMDGHVFGFGLDMEAVGTQSDKDAQEEFEALTNPHRGFRAYYDQLNAIAGAIPVLQPTISSSALLLQIGNADELNRGLIVHQRRGAHTPLSGLILDLPPLPEDTVFIVDAGWSRDYLALETWASPVIARILAVLPDAEIVVMASSFPESFNHIVGEGEETAAERRLFAAMRQRYNQADLTYGDWGSTRLLQNGGGGTIPPRIDVPRQASWSIFRADPNESTTYRDLAADAIAHPCYTEAPDCFGKQLIADTNGLGAGITGTQKATTARVNIHLTIQGSPGALPLTDEQPYVD